MKVLGRPPHLSGGRPSPPGERLIFPRALLDLGHLLSSNQCCHPSQGGQQGRDHS